MKFVVCSILLVLIVALFFAHHAEAAHVCKTPDCSDVVGDHMVKDNLGNSKHFTERHHDDWREEARQRRVEINRRERPSQ